MGRVYEALKRASDAARRERANIEPDEYQQRRSEDGQTSPFPPTRNGEWYQDEPQPWDSSALFAKATQSSASTAHTDAPAGSALPGREASRAAGATLDAAGSARVLRCVSRDINAARVEPHLVSITQPRSAYCEEMRSLRTHVIHLAQQRKIKSIVITSTGVSEGKSLTAINLAWLLAQTDGVRALLIDCDLRQPCLTEYLGIEKAGEAGLSEVLGGTVRAEDSIVQLNPSGLYLLPGGAARPDVAEILSGPRFTALLEEVGDMFDYIIIDAPPLGIFTDATVLINHADGALLVVRSGKTRYPLVDRLLDTLPRKRMLGVVLNRSEDKLAANDYYYQRRYKHHEDSDSESASVPEEGRAIS